MVMFTFRSVFYPNCHGVTTIKGESNLDEENRPRASNVTAIEDDTHIVADLARVDGAVDDEQRFAQPVVTLSSLSSGLLMNSAVHVSVSSPPTDGTIPPLAAEWNDTPMESSPIRTARDDTSKNHNDSLLPASTTAPVNEEASLILPSSRAHSTDTADVVVITSPHPISAAKSFP
jgi:hypothetical protein